MSWIHIKDQKPEINQDVFYFFEVLGVYKGKYEQVNFYEDEEDIEPCWGDCFYGKNGFLTDDVTHWMPAPPDEDWDEVLPDVPEGYIQVHDGNFKGWAHVDEVYVVRQDQYEYMKEQIKYLEAGHKNGLVCPDCPIHIYWKEEKDGYHCGGCGKVYDTLDVEINTYKYISKHDRPCPHCNPYEENTKEYYTNGFLEYTEGVEPYNTEHYQCDKCDSTYCIGDI